MQSCLCESACGAAPLLGCPVASHASQAAASFGFPPCQSNLAPDSVNSYWNGGLRVLHQGDNSLDEPCHSVVGPNLYADGKIQAFKNKLIPSRPRALIFLFLLQCLGGPDTLRRLI